jgi:uncharacterized protein involved in type VI secretion and phage assembly
MAEGSFVVRILGVEDTLLKSNVVEVVVDTNVFLPTMFTVMLEDSADPILGSLMYTDIDPRFSIGAQVSITFETIDLTKGFLPMVYPLVSGEVTSIEPIFDQNGKAMLRIRGYDRLHRLMRGKRTRAFAMTNDTMLATMIAGENGMTPTIAGLPVTTYESVIQYNQTDWEFLTERAQKFGYQIYAKGFSLIASKADAVRSVMPVDLAWKETLSKFEPRVVTVGQVSESDVYGWDPKLKTGVTGLGVVDTRIGRTTVMASTELLKVPLFGMAKDVVIDESIQDFGTASAAAMARFNDIQSQFIRASGEVSNGNPYLVAGCMAMVRGVGIKFSGTYFVTEARHIWRKGNYTVKFEVSGRNPNTIRHLIMGNEPVKTKMDGVVVGLVTNINDPLMLGRVKVRYPSLPMPPLESGWVRCTSTGGGKDRGILFTPEINDEVVIAFENGDINAPFIVGMLWNNMDRPPTGTAPIVAGALVNQRIVKSRSGHVIILDDTAGAEKVIVKDKSGQNSITINSTLNEMEIKSAGNMTIDAGGKLTIKCKQDLAIETLTKGAISGNTGIDVKVAGGNELNLASSGAGLKGVNVKVEGTANVDIAGNAQASIKGNAIVQIQGGIVKIN